MKQKENIKFEARSSEILAMSYYEFNYYEQSWTLISDGERQFLFTCLSLSRFSQEKHHTFQHFLKLPVGCPVWSALPA